MKLLFIILLLGIITLVYCQKNQGKGNKHGNKHGHQGEDKKPKKPHRHGQSKEYMSWVKQNKKASWKEGRNFDENTSIEHFQKLGGSVHKKQRGKGRRRFSAQPETKPATFELPLTFDARIRWPKCPSIREISDQGSCGSCWAMSPSDVMTDRTCILSRGRIKFRFSTEDLMTCCTDCGAGCDGGDPYVSFEYWINNGIVSGGHHNSYTGCRQYSMPPCEHRVTNSSLPLCDSSTVTTPECKRSCDSNYPIPYESDYLKGENAYNISTVEDAMFDLVTKGPISATLLVYQDFFAYKTGVFQETEGAVYLGRHAIRIIGYGEEGGIPYWLCANSWNTDWGDNGTFKIRKGTNECGIEDELLAGTPKL